MVEVGEEEVVLEREEGDAGGVREFVGRVEAAGEER